MFENQIPFRPKKYYTLENGCRIYRFPEKQKIFRAEQQHPRPGWFDYSSIYNPLRKRDSTYLKLLRKSRYQVLENLCVCLVKDFFDYFADRLNKVYENMTTDEELLKSDLTKIGIILYRFKNVTESDKKRMIDDYIINFERLELRPILQNRTIYELITKKETALLLEDARKNLNHANQAYILAEEGLLKERKRLQITR